MNCPSCGTMLVGDDKFCHACGAALKREGECPGCHATVSPELRFCVRCGTPLSTQPAPATPSRVPHVGLGAVALAFICFLMPWVDVNCGGVRETSSGLELASKGGGSLTLLWLLPIALAAAAWLLWTVLQKPERQKEHGRFIAILGAVCTALPPILYATARPQGGADSMFPDAGLTTIELRAGAILSVLASALILACGVLFMRASRTPAALGKTQDAERAGS